MEFKQDYIGLGIFFLICIAFLRWWIKARLGYDKRWFVGPMPLVSSSFYFALPTAIAAMIIGLVGVLLVVINCHPSIHRGGAQEH